MSEHIVYLSGGNRTARKQHICDLCGEPIRSGWKYKWYGQVLDNEIGTFKVHPACEEMTSEWDQMDWESFWPGDGDWPKYADDGSVIQQAEGGQ